MQRIPVYILFFLMLVGCKQSNQGIVEVSQSEYERAFDQYARFNYQEDSNLVAPNVKHLLDSLVRVDFYHNDTSDFRSYIEVFSIGKIPETNEFIVGVAGLTGELFIRMFDKDLNPLLTGEKGNRLPYEYHAYSPKGIWAGEDWCEDLGEPPLNIQIRQRTSEGWTTIREFKDSTLCLVHAWEAESLNDLNSFLFFGDDDCLYMKCHRTKDKSGKTIFCRLCLVD